MTLRLVQGVTELALLSRSLPLDAGSVPHCEIVLVERKASRFGRDEQTRRNIEIGSLFCVRTERMLADQLLASLDGPDQKRIDAGSPSSVLDYDSDSHPMVLAGQTKNQSRLLCKKEYEQ